MPRWKSQPAAETYVPTEPCTKGHSLRYAKSGNCVECHKLRNRKRPSKAEQLRQAIEKTNAIG